VAAGSEAADEGASKGIRRVNEMRYKSAFVSSCKTALSVCALFSSSLGQVQSRPPKAQPSQRGFQTPRAAADALIQAAQAYDVAALKNILGPGGEDLVASEDPVLDKNRALVFAEKARRKNSVSMAPTNSNTAILSVGEEDWPLPIPIVMRNGRWYLDAKAGRAEILLRRIGANELDAITICRGFVDAQKQYALGERTNSGVHQYAQQIISKPGERGGLYWENEDGTSGGPISKAIARAIEEGYTAGDRSSPFHGYYFKVLKGQGPAARLGQLDFVINGVMIGGFALIATPAQYRVTGVNTFMVSHEGIVYQKDLGPDSLKIFQNIDRYNPDKTWRRTDDEW